MHLLIGDLQGCSGALDRLLTETGFSPSRHTLHVLGDLVNRGPDSVGVLQRLVGLGAAASCLLGNHDLHLLAVAAGAQRAHRSDTLQAVLDHPQRDAWLHWLRHCKLADQAHGWLLVHAGVLPGWSTAQALALADEVHAVLRSTQFDAFVSQMYGNTPTRWDAALQGPDRWRVIINALTRLRFCTPDGAMEFTIKESAAQAPPGFLPWFDVPSRASAGEPVAFGHWSTLGPISRPDLLALDTGCVWGGQLTAVRVDGSRREIIQVQCSRANEPVRVAMP